MLDGLKAHFHRPFHYLVRQQIPQEIDAIIRANLYERSPEGTRKELWGKASQELPVWGRQIGWVPEQFPLFFMSESVELEIAESLAGKHGRVIANKDERKLAHLLLDRFGLLELADRNPFFLSEGESRMVGLLSQWAKFPQFLIIGNLPLNLSPKKLQVALDFLMRSDDLARELDYEGPTIILGYDKSSKRNWYKAVGASLMWQQMDHFPELTKHEQNID